MSDSLDSPSSTSKKKAPPFSALEVQSAQGSSLSFDRAEVIVPPRNKTEWLKCQLLTINWTNLALIIAVIAISSSIQGQLDNQRAENLQAIRASNELATMLIPAQQAAAVLQSTATLLAQVNATLALAVQLGFTNLTGQITELELALDNNVLSVLNAVSSNLTSALGLVDSKLASALLSVDTSLNSTVDNVHSKLESALHLVNTSLDSTLLIVDNDLSSALSSVESSLNSTVGHVHSELQSTLHSVNSSLDSTLISVDTDLSSALSSVESSLNSTLLTVDSKTAFSGFSVSGTTLMAPDASGTPRPLSFSAVSIDTAGGWSGSTQYFTVPKTGVWRLTVFGNVQATLSGQVTGVGMSLGYYPLCNTIVQMTRTISPAQTAGDNAVPVPPVTATLRLTAGQQVSACAWSTGSTATAQFGIDQGPGHYQQVMFFMGQFLH